LPDIVNFNHNLHLTAEPDPLVVQDSMNFVVLLVRIHRDHPERVDPVINSVVPGQIHQAVRTNVSTQILSLKFQFSIIQFISQTSSFFDAKFDLGINHTRPLLGFAPSTLIYQSKYFQSLSQPVQSFHNSNRQSWTFSHNQVMRAAAPLTQTCSINILSANQHSAMNGSWKG
jgi:hypothetical protein